MSGNLYSKEGRAASILDATFQLHEHCSQNVRIRSEMWDLNLFKGTFVIFKTKLKIYRTHTQLVHQTQVEGLKQVLQDCWVSISISLALVMNNLRREVCICIPSCLMVLCKQVWNANYDGISLIQTDRWYTCAESQLYMIWLLFELSVQLLFVSMAMESFTQVFKVN